MKRSSKGLILIIGLILTFILNSCATLPDSVTYELRNAPFPHPERENGHTYDGVHYSYEEHYSDSSVLVIIPEAYKKNTRLDIMVFFHGWGNSKDKCNEKFKLGEQLEMSGNDMILVIPEGPKYSRDSYNGKVCDEGGFKRMIDELLENLKQDGVIKDKQLGRILLAGHSGGYYAMGYILRWGGYTEKISDVVIFDGLYALEKDYLNWVMEYNGRLINIYTENGGTKDDTEMFMGWCDSLNIDYDKGETSGLDEMPDDRILMLYSDLGHSDVMHKRENLLKILRSMK